MFLTKFTLKFALEFERHVDRFWINECLSFTFCWPCII